MARAIDFKTKERKTRKDKGRTPVILTCTVSKETSAKSVAYIAINSRYGAGQLLIRLQVQERDQYVQGAIQASIAGNEVYAHELGKTA